MDPRFQGIWKLAVESMTEDPTTETDLSSRSAEELKWLKEVMDKIGKDQTSDVDLMLEALKDAKAGTEIADNLHAAAEFCEDIDFAEVAVKNGQAIGVALKYIPFKDGEIRAAAARLLAAISQNNEKVQEKTRVLDSSKKFNFPGRMTDEDEKSSPDGRKTDEYEDEKKLVKLVEPKTEKNSSTSSCRKPKKNLSSLSNQGSALTISTRSGCRSVLFGYKTLTNYFKNEISRVVGRSDSSK